MIGFKHLSAKFLTKWFIGNLMLNKEILFNVEQVNIMLSSISERVLINSQ